MVDLKNMNYPSSPITEAEYKNFSKSRDVIMIASYVFSVILTYILFYTMHKKLINVYDIINGYSIFKYTHFIGNSRLLLFGENYFIINVSSYISVLISTVIFLPIYLFIFFKRNKFALNYEYFELRNALTIIHTFMFSAVCCYIAFFDSLDFDFEYLGTGAIFFSYTFPFLICAVVSTNVATIGLSIIFIVKGVIYAIKGNGNEF